MIKVVFCEVYLVCKNIKIVNLKVNQVKQLNKGFLRIKLCSVSTILIQNVTIYLIIFKEMQDIFRKLDEIKDLKGQLRYWCRQNQIKISFTVNVTFSKSKAIHKKLQSTYRKGYGKSKSRWLQNELKLFHFAVLAVSVIAEAKIVDFEQRHWKILEQAFPNKPQAILEYEAKNFIINKNQLKNKWQVQEDKLLTGLVIENDDEPKWNQIAIHLFTQSNKRFFRNGKQCRERWLNHLDQSIKHEKWTEEQDLILMKGVLQYGKKWSRIMKCFSNKRTQHMIKNRFLSLILKCKKHHPFIQDEESAIQKIYKQMGLSPENENSNSQILYGERKLRPKLIQIIKQESSDKSSRYGSQQIVSLDEPHQIGQQRLKQNNERELFLQFPDQSILSPIQCIKFNSSSVLATPSPSAFIAPMQFMNCNSFFPGFGYFQGYMNDFYSQLNVGSPFHNPQ